MTDELKPVRCGCGGEAEVFHVAPEGYAGSYCVRCVKCLTQSPFFTGNKEKAIEVWNRAMGERTAKGEWVDGLPYVNSHWWVCSVCHVPAPENHTGYNFCPNCGARMTRGDR